MNRSVIPVRSMAKRSYEFFTSKHSRLFSLGSMKFSWRIVMIVEVLIIGLISYWVCRDPHDLREFEESFLRRYVYDRENTTEPIPSAFRDRQELTEQLCQQFVPLSKKPRLAVRLLGFKKAIHKKVPIEVVKCGGGVGLIQAPGVNSFFVLRKGKQSKRFATRVFNIYRKAYFTSPYSDEEDYEKPIRTRPQSRNEKSAPYPLRAGPPHSDFVPRRSYSAEYNAHTRVSSDMADEVAIPHVPRWDAEDCLSPRLAVRSPLQYHSLTDAERYGIRYSPPSQMDRALKLIRRIFSTSRGKRHRMRAESSTLPLSVNVSKAYRSRSAPRGRPRNDDFDTERTIRQGAITDQVRQPYPQDRYYPQAAHERRSLSVPRQYPSSTRNVARQYSPPNRELDREYNFRVRLSQMNEDPRARNTSFYDQYATRGLHGHRSTSDRDDIRQPRAVTTARPQYESMLYEREDMRDAPYRSLYATRSLPNHPNYASTSEDGHVRRVQIPTAYSQEKRYAGGMYNDYLVGGGASQNHPTDEQPYYRSHGAEAERVRPTRASATEEPVYAMPSYYSDPRFQPAAKYHDSTSVGRSHVPPRERPTAQNSRKLVSVPIAEPAARPTHGSSTCHKCKSTLAKPRQTDAGPDWGARTQVASDPRSHSKSAEKQGAPGAGVRVANQSRSARPERAQTLRDGRQEVSSIAADDGSDEDGRGRSVPPNFRGSRSVRVSSTLHRDEDQPRSSAAQASRARSSKQRAELAKPPVVTDDEVSTASERDYSSSRRRTRTSAAPRSRPNRPRTSGGKEKEDTSRRKVTFAVSIDGEPEQ